MNTTSIIKGLRAKKSMNQKDVAEKLDISRQTYNTIENDILHTDFTLVFNLLKILEASDRDIEDFFNALQQDYKSYTNSEEQ